MQIDWFPLWLSLRVAAIATLISLGLGLWLASELVGCSVEGLGEVKRVVDAPSCAVLELDDGTLVPFVSDAILAVDTRARTIKADTRWLGQQ